MRVWTTDISNYENCPREYYYKRVQRIETETRSANLAFGVAVDEAISAFIRADSHGQHCDPVAVFKAAWQTETENKVIEYSTQWTPEEMEATGARLMEMFPEVWKNSGYMPLLTEAGEPMVQYKIETEILKSVILVQKIDLVAMAPNGQVGPLDFKTPASPTELLYLEQSDQLTSYQIGCDHRRDVIGIDKTDFVGFWELIKRKMPKKTGKGPEVMLPATVPARCEAQVIEFKRKVAWMVNNIRNGHFPKTPRLPHNTPCDMCDYRNYCAHGDTTGLIFPAETQQQKLALVE